MSSFHQFAAGLELFRAPIDRSLSAELVACLKSLPNRNGRVTTGELKKCGLARVLKQRLGLNLLFFTRPDDPTTGLDAYFLSPQLNKNNPVINHELREFFTNNDFHRLVSQSRTVLSGTVDLKTGRVNGFFSEITSEIFLGSYILNEKYFSTEEVVAILLHEVGHLVTYYAALTSMVRTNYVLQAVNTETFKDAPVTAKILMMDEIDKAQDITLKDKEVLAKGNADIVIAMVVKEQTLRTRSELGYDFYDERCFEAMADQFCTFMGMGTALASTLLKFNKYSGNNTFTSSITDPFFKLFFGYLFLGMGYVIRSILASILSGKEDEDKTYDILPERVSRIKERMIRDLKLLDRPREEVDTLLSEIEQLQTLKIDYQKKFNLGSFIADKVLPWKRRNIKAVQLQQEMEKLAQNELYLKSAQLRGL